MLVAMRPIDSIAPYASNPRLNDAAVEAVAKSIEAYGWRQPIVVDEAGVIIVGHTRWKAAKQLGMTAVPVHVAVGLSVEQARAYRLADNQTATIAEWDDAKLIEELKALQEADFDLDLTGFNDDQLSQYLFSDPAAGEVEPDDVPALPDAATTQPGDLWLLGDHRLLCGDSSKAEDVDRLLAGATIQLVNTDPPYNVRVEPRSVTAIAAGVSSFPQYATAKANDPTKPKQKLRAKDRMLANDSVTDEEFQALLLAWFGQIARVLDAGRSFYIWGGYGNLGNYPAALKANEMHFAQCIVWDKQHPVMGRKDFLGCYDQCYYGWKLGKAHEFFGPNNAPDLWSIKKVTHQSMIHLCEKPVELAVRAMQYSSRAGENVLDLFGGSGSTLIAAEQLGRKAYLMELDPLYVDCIVQRFETFTGKKAKRVPANPALADTDTTDQPTT